MLAMFAVWSWVKVPPGGHPERRAITTTVSDAASPQPQDILLPDPPDEKQPAEAAASESEAPSPLRMASEELSAWMRRELAHELQHVEEQPASASVERLEELAGRLQRSSTESRVLAITDRIAQALGTAERPTASDRGDLPRAIPKPPPSPAGEQSSVTGEPFDFSRSQFDNVFKQVDDNGQVNYTGILIDPEGRTLEVELEPAEGEELYRLFETIRRFPLLEQVYRKLVMSLLDRMVDENRIAEPATSPESP